MATLELLFQTLRVANFEVRNRFVNTAHGTRLSRDRDLRYLRERARGVGLVGIHSSGASDLAMRPGRWDSRWGTDFDVVPPDPTSPEGIEFYDLAIPTIRRRAEACHDEGAKVFAQVLNLGAGAHAENLRHAVAPSTVPEPYDMAIPHELGEEEIAKVVIAFAHGVRRAKEAGADAAELHGAHGYLLQQFMSPKYNKRADRYGGSRENRVRFVLEIIDAAARLAPGFPIGIRVGMDSDGDRSGGLGAEELAAVARLLAPRVAFINVSGGTYTGLGDGLGQAYLAPWYGAAAPNLPAAAAVKKAAGGTPVFVAHKITDPVMAERILAEGSADMVGMVRALIADPELPQKTKAGGLKDIRRCVGLNECHYAGAERHISCAINPATGREAEMEIVPAAVARRILVVGGGPAGMEAARVAALRGHRVTLVDRGPALGGAVRILALDRNRGDLGEFPRYMARELARAKVDVQLKLEATVDTVRKMAPEVVVVATGSRPHVPEVPGITPTSVMTALDVIGGTATPGRRVLVVGEFDNHVGPGTVADFLAGAGHEVDLVSEQVDFAGGAENVTRYMLMDRLAKKGVAISLMTGLVRVDDGGALLRHTFSGKERRVEVDTVVIAAGRRADDSLAKQLRGVVKEIVLIGDCLAPRRIIHATLDGARAAQAL